MRSEFGQRVRQTFVDSVTKGVGIAGTAQFGPLWAMVDPFVRLAISTFSEPPADRAIAALLANWEKDAERRELIDQALGQLHDRTMQDLKKGFGVLDALEVERRGNRETLARRTVVASLAGVYAGMRSSDALRYLRILGVSENLLAMNQDDQYLSMIRDALSCQIHPLARFSFEVGFFSVSAATDIDVARVGLKLAGHWVGLDALVDPFFSDLQRFLDLKDQDGLIELVKDFASGLATFAGVPRAST